MNCLLGEKKSQQSIISAAATAASNTSSSSSASTTSSSSSALALAAVAAVAAAATTASPTNNSKTNNCNNTTNSNINNNLSATNQNNNISHSTSSNINIQESCLICGDVASGKHYGLRSCEACKAFFKRTVQGKIEYSCPATRECEINKRRRKACQACRFQKCLNMGMLKEGVRLDRVRGGRQKYRRGTSPTPNNVTHNSGGGGGVHANANTLTLTSGCQSIANTTSMSISDSTNTSETNRIMTALVNCEPEELTASPAHYNTTIPSTLSVQMKTLYILSDLFDRELVSLIGWAKQLPGFSETITLNDQMRLLQSTWAEVIALSIGYRSHLRRVETCRQQQQQQFGNGNQIMMTTPSPTSSSPASTASSYTNHNSSSNINCSNSNSYNLDSTEIRLVFAKDLIIDFRHAVACGAEEIFYNCVQLIKRLDHLKITPNEYILLKAISLTNADVRLENPAATYRLRDLVMNTMFEATFDCWNGSGRNASSTLSSVSTNTSNQKDRSGNPINQQIKVEAQQDKPLNSTNQYTSTSPSRPSSSSASSISPLNNNSCSNDLTSVDLGSRRAAASNRMNQVLLCLPVLRQIDSCIRKFWNDVRKGPNTVPMNKLFEEMLEPCQRMYRSAAEM